MILILLSGLSIFCSTDYGKKVLERPFDPYILYNAGLEAAQQKQYEQANNYFDLAFERTSDEELRYKIQYNQVNALTHQQRYEKALEVCESLYNRRSDDKRLPPKIEFLKNMLTQQEKEKTSEQQDSQQKNEEQKSTGDHQAEEQKGNEKKQQDTQEKKEKTDSQQNTKPTEEATDGDSGQPQAHDQECHEQKDFEQQKTGNEHTESTKNLLTALENIDHQYAHAMLKKQVSRLTQTTDKQW